MPKLMTAQAVVTHYGEPYARSLRMYQLGIEPPHNLVFTNGCFDVLHPGHIALLQEARKLGAALIVGMNSDASLARLKGAARPVIDEEGRYEMLAALACVDAVVIFDDDTPLSIIEAIKPDILVKGDDYAGCEIVGAREVYETGGEVILLPRRLDPRTNEPYSTSRIIIAGT